MQNVLVFCSTIYWLVCDKSEPVVRRSRAVLEDAGDCEALIRALCLFWEMVAKPYLPLEIINYQNAVLAYKVRMHKTPYLRMILSNKETGALHLDVVVYFEYRCPPACNEAQELRELNRVFEICKDLKYEVGDLVPVPLYTNNRILVNKQYYSHVEKVTEQNPLTGDETVELLEIKDPKNNNPEGEKL